MHDLVTAVGLVMVIEGVLYALYPDGMKRMAVTVAQIPAAVLRRTGLLASLAGFFIVWLVKG